MQEFLATGKVLYVLAGLCLLSMICKWMTKSLDETVRYRGRYLPKSWRESIRYIQPKMTEEKKLVD